MVSGGSPRARRLLVVAGVYVLLGGSWATAAPPTLSESPLLLLPLFLLILALTDGLGEELAWRGFALTRLLLRHYALTASLSRDAPAHPSARRIRPNTSCVSQAPHPRNFLLNRSQAVDKGSVDK